MNFFQRLKGESVSVGLDIGNHSLKLVKMRHTKDGNILEACGVKELPEGTIVGSDIKNRSALIDAITTLVNQCDPRTVEVVISMSGHGIISDKFTFKIDPGENAEELILWEAGQRSPFDVDDITLDYKILSRNMQTGEVEVLIIAAKNQIMQSYIDLLYDAGLKPVIVDVDAFAVTNCYIMESSGKADHGVLALLNIGHDLTSITFIKDGVVHSMRSISTAGEYFGTTVQRNLAVSKETAAALLKGKPTGSSVDPQLFKQSVEFAAEELSAGIDLAFSYFKSSEKSDTIDKIVISGGGAFIPGIAEFLEKRHETSVAISNPLTRLVYDPGLFGAVNPQRLGALLTVATGLALRRVGEA
jgi:type IV pilus assembly protein PilM